SNGDLIWDIVANKVIWQPGDGLEEITTYQNDYDYIYKEQLIHFFNCIENKKSPTVSIHDGAIVLNMIESVKKSHKIGKKVAIA
ncbi:hypothetical protein HN928_07090, partial [bacterium]|nr:hypothetical protein [bacterium]